MIQALRLRNFQRHRRLQIAFAPGITSIRGRSDAGKSSIVRALRWSLLNDIPGASFIRRGSVKASVRVRVDGKIVSRFRSPSLNLYKLDKEPFRSFGNIVPQPVKDAARVNEINFQNQHDSPFWFSESAPEVSRQLNRVVDLSIIDESLTQIGQEVRKAQEREAVSRERLAQARTKLRELKPQQERIKEFEALWSLNSRQVERVRKSVKLSLLLQQIEKTHQIQPPPDFSGLQQQHQNLRKLRRRLEQVENIIEQAHRAVHQLRQARSRIKATALQLKKETKGKLCPLCQSPIVNP